MIIDWAFRRDPIASCACTTTMEGGARGMPLLSGPPPPEVGGETHCRNCCKEFNLLFARAKRCFHCGPSPRSAALLTHSLPSGYSYCSSSACSGHQALMPRAGGTGYEVQPVCSLCIEMLMSKSVPRREHSTLTRRQSLPAAKDI